VMVNTYTKNADGTFTPDYTFNPPAGQVRGECFYVNAVVVNDGNATASGNITATLVLPGNAVILCPEAGESLTKDWPGNQGTINLLTGRMADFWWKVCCNAEGMSQTITVDVTSGTQGCANHGHTSVNQVVTGVTDCLAIKIVEAPGLGPVTGRLINSDTQQPVVYESGMPDILQACQNFGIKAEITNLCTYPVPVGNAHITYSTDTATLVGGDTADWLVGTLQPLETVVVAWTLHCDGPGEVDITVHSTGARDIEIDTVPHMWAVTVYQETAGALDVEITEPTPEHSCVNSSDLTIKQATIQNPSCGAADFDVQATVEYTGVGIVNDVYVELRVSPIEGWVELGTTYDYIRVHFLTLTGGVVYPVNFGNVTCIGEGPGNLTVRAYSMQPAPPAEDTDVQAISQQKVIATKDPTSTTGYYQNICDPDGFDVSFRYYNYSGFAWPAEGLGGNVTSCVKWDIGNVSLQSVEWRKINSPEQVPPQNPDTWANLTFSQTIGQACVTIPEVVCKCCAFDVRWHFQCTGNKPTDEVTFYGNVTVQETLFSGSDTSEPICVEQEWKADLWTDILFFYQNENGLMIEQDGMVPGEDFHVVIPVMNTGEATAEEVNVYFIITDIPAGGCPDSYRYVSASGEGNTTGQGSVSFNPVTGVGVAHFHHIGGGDMEKVVLKLHCLCEGSVRVEIPLDMPAGVEMPPGVHWIANDPGMKATDGNTDKAVPVDDIHVPPCPMYFYQIPFTVEIENPFTCQTFMVNDIFAVKALIHNGSQQKLENVTATLHWNVNGNVTAVTPQGGVSGVNSWTKTVGVDSQPGNISAGLDTEITWMLQCTGPGEVYLTVSASSETSWLTTTSEVVNVHQIQPPGACLSVTILSPDEHQVGQDWDVGRKHAMIATGQQFAVTAKISNGQLSSTAEGVMVDINPVGCDSLHYVTLVDPETEVQGPFTIPGNSSQIVTWTLYGGSEHDFWMMGCDAVEDTICVNATMTTTWAANCPSERQGNATDSVDVSVYPAAFLKASMDISPSTTAVLGDEFTVDYTITNYGVADATTVVATLAADNSNVHLAAGTGGWSQAKDTIAGWSFGEPYNSVSGSFTLVGTAQGLSTLTITPTGEDECGWHALVGEECYSEPDNGGEWWECEPQYNWVQFGLLPIQSRFLIPDSETVALSATGECPDVTSVTIALNSGWNMISLPLRPTGGSVSVATLFSGKPVDAIWGYSGGAPVIPTVMVDGQGYWVHMTAAGNITVNGTVNPAPPAMPPTYSVAEGWNLIGFKSTCARTASSYLGNVPWVRIWSFVDGKWAAVQSGDKMQPGLGYWLAATDAGMIYP